MANKQYPGWAYLFAGIMIGVFVSFIIYLQKQPSSTIQPTKTIAQQTRPATDTNHAEESKPRFDFYNILPELEIVVPALEVLPEKDKSKTNHSAALKPTPTLEKGEKFILQAGSFKELKEADKLKASLALLGLEARIQKVTVDNNTWHRVRLGPFDNPYQLNEARRRLRDNSIQAITLKISS